MMAHMMTSMLLLKKCPFSGVTCFEITANDRKPESQVHPNVQNNLVAFFFFSLLFLDGVWMSVSKNMEGSLDWVKNRFSVINKEGTFRNTRLFIKHPTTRYRRGKKIKKKNLSGSNPGEVVKLAFFFVNRIE